MADLSELVPRLAVGALAGAAATFAMRRIGSFIEKRQDVETDVEEAWAKKKPAEEVVIDKLEKTTGKQLHGRQRDRTMKGMKWGLSIGSSVATAYIRKKMGANNSLLRGALFGALTFVVVDELLKPAIGVHRGVTELPWQSHARKLAAHTTYGVVNAGVRRTLNRALPI